MKVSELIVQLQDYDPDANVYKEYYNDGGNGCCSYGYGSDVRDELEDVFPSLVDVRELAPGPRGGPVKLRNVAKPAVIVR